MKAKLAKLSAVVISIALVVILLSQIRIADIITTLAGIDPLYLSVGFALYASSYFFRALRFYILLNGEVGIRGLFNIVCVHNMMNNLLPARTGELSYIYLLKKLHNQSTGEGIATLTIARIFDFITISLFFFISALLIVDLPAIISNVVSGIVFFLILIVLFLIFLVCGGEKFMCDVENITEKSNLNRFRLTKFLLEKMNKIIDSFSVIQSKKVILSSFLLSFLIWSVLYSMNYVLLKGMNMDLSIISIVLGSTFSIFACNLPVPSLGLFGIYEGAWTAAFVSLGVSKESAMITGFGIHLILFVYFLVLGCFGLIVMKREENKAKLFMR